MNQTQTAALDWRHGTLAAAVVCWAASFFCGCKYLDYIATGLYANAELLRVQTGQHPDTGQDSAAIASRSRALRDALESTGARSVWYANWQFRLLTIGAVFYIAWHIGEMYTRRVASAPQVLQNYYIPNDRAAQRAPHTAIYLGVGGGRGIRTPDTLSGTTVFKTAAINHSAIPPWWALPV